MIGPESFGEFENPEILKGVSVSRVYNLFDEQRKVVGITDDQVKLLGEKPWQCPQDQCQAIAKARTPELLMSTEHNDTYGYPTEYTNMQIVTPSDEIREDEAGNLYISCRCVECETAYDMSLHRSLADDFDLVIAGVVTDITHLANELAKSETL